MNSLIYLLINYNLKISQVNQLELKSRRLQLKFHFDFTIFLSKQTNSLKMTGMLGQRVFGLSCGSRNKPHTHSFVFGLLR